MKTHKTRNLRMKWPDMNYERLEDISRLSYFTWWVLQTNELSMPTLYIFTWICWWSPKSWTLRVPRPAWSYWIWSRSYWTTVKSFKPAMILDYSTHRPFSVFVMKIVTVCTQTVIFAPFRPMCPASLWLIFKTRFAFPKWIEEEDNKS